MKSYQVTCCIRDREFLLLGIVHDGIMNEAPYRWFVDAEGERHEVPMTDGMIFRFGPERAEIIAENMELQRKAKAAEEQQALTKAKDDDYYEKRIQAGKPQ